MECTPIIIARVECRRWYCALLFVISMKSSTNNSRRLMNNSVVIRQWLVESCAVSSMRFLKWFSGRLNYCRTSSITSLALSEAAQKKVRYLHQPICRQLGTTMLIYSSYLVRVKYGSTYKKFNASCLFICGLQKPSLMSRLAKRSGWLGLQLSIKFGMIIFMHDPNCIMDYAGAYLIVVYLAEYMSCLLCFRRKDRSRRILNYRNL